MVVIPPLKKCCRIGPLTRVTLMLPMSQAIATEAARWCDFESNPDVRPGSATLTAYCFNPLTKGFGDDNALVALEAVAVA